MEAFAKPSVNLKEPYETTEHDVQAIPGVFETTFKPNTTTANPTFTHSESLQVSETHPDVGLSKFEEEIIRQSQAKFSYILKEATGVTETEISQRETTFEKDTLKTVSADKGVVPQEGLEIVEITEGQFEDKFTGAFKPVPIKPKVLLPSSEPIIVSEVETGDRPSDYKPKALSTETAVPSVIPQKQLVMSEMNAPEMEGTFIPGQLPITQVAEIDITTGQSLVVHEQQIHEREGRLLDEKPELTTATKNITLLEGVTVSMVDSQLPQNEFEVEELQHKKADVDYVPQESAISTVTQVAESEGQYIPGQLPEGKSASTTITCLETSHVIDTTVQEKEGVFEEQKPQPAFAAPDIRPEESIEVHEVTTADVPKEFKDIFEYPTNTAETTIVTQESKEVSETFVQEKEAGLKEQILPETFNVQKSYIKQQEIQVLETQFIEKEGSLTVFDLPETHKGKTVPTHLLHTSITEETLPGQITGKLDKPETRPDMAKVRRDMLEETVIEEAVLGDYILKFTPGQKPETTKADMKIPEDEGLSITEIIAQDKESIYKPEELPKELYATPDILSQKVAIKSEVHPEISAEQLSIEQPTLKQAVPEQSTLESLLVTHSEIVEKEGVFIKGMSPEKHQAAVDITEANEGIRITEVISHDKEKEYVEEDTPKGVSATPNITGQTVVVKSEIVTGDNFEQLKEEDLSVKANTLALPFDELVVTETTPTDVERILPQDVFPEKKKVNVLLSKEHELAISEILIHEKEGSFKAGETPEERRATIDFIEKIIAMQQEVVPGSMVDKFDRLSPTKDQATPIQDILKYIMQSQHTLIEKEGIYQAEVKPDEKVADVTLIEEEGVTVTFVQPEDKERRLSEGEKPEEFTASSNIDGQTVAITSELVPNLALDKMEDETPMIASAKPEQIPFESMFTSEAIAHEKEGIYTGDIKPVTQTASADIELGESVTVTAVTTGDREKPLPMEEKPEMMKASTDITGHIVAESIEVQTANITSRLDRESPVKATATPDHSLFESIQHSETAVAEKEGLFTEQIKPDMKTAGIAFEEGTPIVVTEVIVDSKESEYKTEEIEHKFATPDLTGTQKIAEKSEIVPEVGIGKLDEEQPETAQATADQLTFESIVQTEVMVKEKEAILEKDAPVDKFSAKPVYEENKSVTITEITSANKEETYEAMPKPEERTAKPEISGHEIAAKFEIISNEAPSSFMEEVVKKVEAETKQDTFESITAFETTLAEAETILEAGKKPITRSADVTITHEEGVTVTTVVSSEKESELTISELPVTKSATTDITELTTIATKTEIETALATGSLVIEKEKSASARVEQIPIEVLTRSEIASLEQEGIMPADVLPESQKAKFDIITGQSVIVQQVTPGDYESQYVPDKIPQKQTATADIGKGHEVAEQSHNIMIESFKTFEEKMPKVEEAKPDTEAHLSGVIVTEDYVQEKEKDFVGKFTPTLNQPDIGIEEGKKVQVVTEIVLEDREGIVGKFDVPVDKIATAAFTGHEVAQKSEIQPHVAPGEYLPAELMATSAELGHIPHQSLVQSEPTIRESEGFIDTTLQYVTKSANILLEQSQSMTITEVMTQDKEGELPVPEQPKMNLAEPKIIGKEVAQRTEVLPQSSTGELQIEKPTQVSAKTEQGTFEGLIQTQTQTGEVEEHFEKTFTPSTKTVDINFEEGHSISVTEVLATDKEEHHPAFETPEGRTALPSFTTKEVVQAFSIEAHDTIKNITQESVEKKHASVDQNTFESLIQIQPLVVEKEAEFKDKIVLDTKTAETVLELGKSINVSQVVPHDHEEEFKPEEVVQKTAQPAILSQESIQQTMVQTQQTVKHFEDKIVLDTKTAETVLELGKSVNVTQVIHQEQESEFKPDEVVQKTAQPEILSQEPLEQTVVQPQMTVKHFEDKIVLDTKTAETVLELGKSINVTQVISQEQEGDFKPEEIEQKTAQPGILTKEPITQTMVQPQMNVKHFDDKIVLDTKTAETVLELGKSVTVTQVIHQEQEEIFKPEEVVKKTAQPEILSQEPLEQTIVQPHMTVKHFDEKIVFDTKTAETILELGKSISVSQVVSEEREDVFKPEEIIGKQAQPHILSQEPIEQTEVQPQMTVKHFDDKVVFDTKTAETTLELGKSITVSQVITQDKEEEFKADEVVGKTAQPEILSQEPLQQTMVQPQMTVKHFDDKVVLDTKTAETVLELGKSINVTQVVSQEQESEFKSEEIVHKTAQPQIPLQEPVEQSMVQPQMNVRHFDDKIVLDTKVAETVLELGKSVNVTQVVSEEREDVFKIDEVEHKTAQSQLPIQEPLEQSMVQSHMTVKHFDDKIEFDTKTAEAVLELGKSVNITQVISEEREHELKVDEIVKKQAQPQIPIQEPIEQSMVQSHMNVKQFEDKIVFDTKVAEAVLELGKSVTITQVIHQEQETEFKPEEFTAKTAQTSLPVQEPVEQSMVQSHMNVQQFDDKIVFDTKTAEAVLELGKSVNVTQVVVEEQGDEFTAEVIEGRVAQTEILSQEPIEQSIVQSHMNVKEFEDKIVFDTKTAETILELGKTVSVTQVVAHEQEEELKTEELVSRTAQPQILSQEPVEQTTVETHMHVQQFKDQSPEMTFAQLTQDQLEGVIISESIVQEKEKAFETIKDITESKVTIGITGIKAAAVSETIPSDREGVLPTEPKALEAKAKPDIEAQEIAEKTIITTESTVEELSTIKPISAQGEVKQTPLESISVQESTVVEKEGKFEDKIKPGSTVAKVLLDEQESITVTQVISDDKEKELVHPDKPKKQKADKSILSQTSIELSETLPLDSIKGMPDVKTDLKKAKKDQLPFESLVQTEIAVTEKEQSLSVQKIPDSVSAAMNLQVDQEITVTEVLPQETSTDKVITGVAEEVAKPDVVQRQVAVKTETLTDDTIKEFTTEEVTKMTLKSSLPDQKLSLIVTESSTDDTIKEFTTQKVKEMTLKSSLPDEKVSLIVTESSTDDTVKEFTMKKTPEMTLKSSLPDQQHSLIVTEQSTGELESVLPDKTKPSTRTASLSVEQCETNVQVTEVFPHDKEGELIVYSRIVKPVSRSVTLRQHKITQKFYSETFNLNTYQCLLIFTILTVVSHL